MPETNSVDEWSDRVDQLASGANWGDTTTASWAAMALVPDTPAQVSYKLGKSKGKDFAKWPTLKAYLKEQFTKPVEAMDRMDQLRALKQQPQEGVQAYSDRMELQFRGFTGGLKQADTDARYARMTECCKNIKKLTEQDYELYFRHVFFLEGLHPRLLEIIRTSGEVGFENQIKLATLNEAS